MGSESYLFPFFCFVTLMGYKSSLRVYKLLLGETVLLVMLFIIKFPLFVAGIEPRTSCFRAGLRSRSTSSGWAASFPVWLRSELCRREFWSVPEFWPTRFSARSGRSWRSWRSPAPFTPSPWTPSRASRATSSSWPYVAPISRACLQVFPHF